MWKSQEITLSCSEEKVDASSSFRTGLRKVGMRLLGPGPLLAVLAIFLVSGIVAFTSYSGSALASTLSEKREELEAASARLAGIQAELDELTRRYTDAESRLYEIEDAVADTQKKKDRAAADLDSVQGQFNERLVRIYKQKHTAAPPPFLEILLEGEDLTVVLSRLSMLNRVARQDEDILAQVSGYLEEMQSLEKELQAMKAEQKKKVQELGAAGVDMEQRMRHFAAEYNRLKSRVAELEEAARRARREAKARARAQAARSSGSSAALVGFVFPVRGPHSYVNDWGNPRSSGRRHRGTDIFAPRGTLVVATVDGIVATVKHNRGLGGTTVWLNGYNGVGYYFAHLDSIAGGIRGGVRVSAGRVIGYVGNTGNARGGATHLHLQIHPGNGSAINPYPILRATD